MGIYIRGMKMPDNCGACYIGFCKQIDCERYIGFDDYARRRHPDCPLVEVPPHGRLIDADEFVKLRIDWYCENCERRKNSNGRFVYEIGGVPCRACDIGDMIDAVDDAPTVVEGNYPPSVPLEQVWTELFGEDGE